MNAIIMTVIGAIILYLLIGLGVYMKERTLTNKPSFGLIFLWPIIFFITPQ